MARDLLAEARHLNARAGRPSKLERLIDALDGEERAEVIDLVWHDGSDHQPSNRAIAQVLTKYYGDRFGPFSLQLVQRQRQRPRPS